jgi:hypothetical protein
MQVVGQSILLDQSPIFGLIEGQDRKIAIVDQFCAVEDFATVLRISLALCFDHISGNTQTYRSIERPSITLVTIGIRLEGMDFVIQKAGGFGFGMGDAGFGF